MRPGSIACVLAGWAGGARTDNPVKEEMTQLYMQIEDARNTLSCAMMEAPEEINAVRMRDAGLVLADQVQRLEREVERLQARCGRRLRDARMFVAARSSSITTSVGRGTS